MLDRFDRNTELQFMAYDLQLAELYFIGTSLFNRKLVALIFCVYQTTRNTWSQINIQHITCGRVIAEQSYTMLSQFIRHIQYSYRIRVMAYTVVCRSLQVIIQKLIHSEDAGSLALSRCGWLRLLDKFSAYIFIGEVTSLGTHSQPAVTPVSGFGTLRFLD